MIALACLARSEMQGQLRIAVARVHVYLIRSAVHINGQAVAQSPVAVKGAACQGYGQTVGADSHCACTVSGFCAYGAAYCVGNKGRKIAEIFSDEAGCEIYL